MPGVIPKILLISLCDLFSSTDNRNMVLYPVGSVLMMALSSSYDSKSAMSDGATLILSGFYEQDADMLINSAERLGLKTVKRETRHQWCMLVFENADA